MSTSIVEARGLGVKGVINVRLTEKVTLDNLNAIVARVAGLTGCTHCGLLGIDLRLTGDPVEANQLKGLPGVQSVGFGG
jgi:hypothetical protein